MSDDLQEECHSAVLHDNIKISCLMVHAKHVEKASLGGRIEMLRGQNILMNILKRIGLQYKTSLDLRSGFQVKSLPSSQSLVMIGFLTLSSRRERY